MTETMSLDGIKQLALNYRQHRDLPVSTNAAFIDIKEFLAFLTAAQASHPECDTLQVNFIRYNLSGPENWILPAGNNLSQVSLQFFPVKATNNLDWQVRPPGETEIVTFKVCPPGSYYKEGVSGICPPRGNCSDQNTD